MKQRLRKSIYRLLCPLVGNIGLSKNHYVNVIYYHDIVKREGNSFMRTNIDVFKRQMEWLVKQQYETLRFDDLRGEHLMFKKRRVLIAFDDGWLSNYTAIFDFMRERGLKYNVFLTVGEIGTNTEYLTWDMVRIMHSSGLCGFGAHTYTHPDMSDLTKVDFAYEIYDANTLFEQQLGYTPKDFCYPFGYYSEASNLLLERETGYERIYTSQDLFSYEQNGRIVMGRNGISNDDSDFEFQNKVKGYNNCFYSLRRKLLG